MFPQERRKRLPGPLLVAGFCLPKGLTPVLDIYLEGILRVRACRWLPAWQDASTLMTLSSLHTSMIVSAQVRLSGSAGCDRKPTPLCMARSLAGPAVVPRPLRR